MLHLFDNLCQKRSWKFKSPFDCFFIKLVIKNLFQKARLEVDFQTSRFGEVEWAHTLEKHDTEVRLIFC